MYIGYTFNDITSVIFYIGSHMNYPSLLLVSFFYQGFIREIPDQKGLIFMHTSKYRVHQIIRSMFLPSYAI